MQVCVHTRGEATVLTVCSRTPSLALSSQAAGDWPASSKPLISLQVPVQGPQGPGWQEQQQHAEGLLAWPLGEVRTQLKPGFLEWRAGKGAW